VKSWQRSFPVDDFICCCVVLKQTKAPVGEQFEAMRALNEAELQFTAAHEHLIAHKAEHASHDGKDK
jgi:hypothetical protein